MHILRQAGLNNLMKHRNTKPQSKKSRPVVVEATPAQKLYESPVIAYGPTQVVGDLINLDEAAKNTPCFNYTVSQLEKMVDKPKEEIKENKEKGEMPTLGEIARVSITPPQERLGRESIPKYVVSYLKAHPLGGFNTTGSALARAVIREYHLSRKIASVTTQISNMVRLGKLIRTRQNNKNGNQVAFNFTLPEKGAKPVPISLTKAKKASKAQRVVEAPAVGPEDAVDHDAGEDSQNTETPFSPSGENGEEPTESTEVLFGEVFHDQNEDGVWKGYDTFEILNHLTVVIATGMWTGDGKQIFNGDFLETCEGGALGLVFYDFGLGGFAVRHLSEVVPLGEFLGHTSWKPAEIIGNIF